MADSDNSCKVEKRKVLRWDRCPKCGTENFIAGNDRADCLSCDWTFDGECYVEVDQLVDSDDVGAKDVNPVVSLQHDDWFDLRCVVGSLILKSDVSQLTREQWYLMTSRVDERNGIK